jgi:FSR family fosmidomycin resistance protein-like MFS transporter
VTHFTQHFIVRLVPPLIPVLAVLFEYPLWQLGLLVSGHYVGSGLIQAPLGVLSDRYDRLYILPTGIVLSGFEYVLFVSLSFLRDFLPAMTVAGRTFDGGFIVMFVSMLVVGVGSAVVHPTGYPMITANVSDENKGKVLGSFGSMAKVGDAAGPALVGVMILTFDWDQIMLIGGLATVAFGIGLYLSLRGDEFETLPAGRTEAQEDTESPLSKDKRMFTYPMTVIYVFFVTKMFAGNGVSTFLPTFVVGVYAYSIEFQQLSIASESVANFYFAGLLLCAAVTQLYLGGLTGRYDPRVLLTACTALATVVLVVLALVNLSPALLLLTVLVVGAGLWGLNPTRDALISEITPKDHEGRTFGYIWTAVMLTGSVMPVIVGYIMDSSSLRLGFLVLAAGTILATVAIGLLFSDRVYLEDPDQPPLVPGSD